MSKKVLRNSRVLRFAAILAISALPLFVGSTCPPGPCHDPTATFCFRFTFDGSSCFFCSACHPCGYIHVSEGGGTGWALYSYYDEGGAGDGTFFYSNMPGNTPTTFTFTLDATFCGWCPYAGCGQIQHNHPLLPVTVTLSAPCNGKTVTVINFQCAA